MENKPDCSYDKVYCILSFRSFIIHFSNVSRTLIYMLWLLYWPIINLSDTMYIAGKVKPI